MSGSCLFGLLLVSNIATFVSSFSVSYFAYGSNLNRSVLQVRTASLFIPPPVAVRLPDWVLTINLGTAASVEECVGGYCEGRVYELSPRAFALLCATEGVPLAYKVKPVVGVNMIDGKDVRAYTFVSGRGIKKNKTTKSYKKILVEGAKEGGSSLEYIRELEKLETYS